jgi:tetratricopeptide (TPR) repeat protein
MICRKTISKNRVAIFSVTILLLATGCVTPAQKREMNEDIQRLKESVVALQQAINEGRTHTQSSGEIQQKNLASTHADLERLQQDIKRVRGDIDALKVGVTTGQMPGQEVPPEGTVATQLGDIRARLDALEAKVAELAVSGVSSSRKSDKGDKKGDQSSVNADPDSLEKAFERKKYKEVAQDAPVVLKKVKGKDKEKILTMYGDSLAKINRHKEAALQYNEILEMKPSEKVAASTTLKLAESFKAMGDKETSKLFYEDLVTKYPDSSEAQKAKKALGHKK